LKKSLFSLFLVLAFTLPAFGAQAGWESFSTYYKPFVTVERPQNKLVLFITPNGRVYRGKCRKRKRLKKCRVYPRKKFNEPLALRYLILKLSSFSPPEIVETGVIK
jgi:hypothetical protein